MANIHKRCTMTVVLVFLTTAVSQPTHDFEENDTILTNLNSVLTNLVEEVRSLKSTRNTECKDNHTALANVLKQNQSALMSLVSDVRKEVNTVNTALGMLNANITAELKDMQAGVIAELNSIKENLTEIIQMSTGLKEMKNNRINGNATKCADIPDLEPSIKQYRTIDPDGDGGLPAFKVVCESPSKSIVHHGQESRTLVNTCSPPGCYRQDITYEATMEQIIRLIRISSHCTQTYTYDCYHSVITRYHAGSNAHTGRDYDWSVGRIGVRIEYAHTGCDCYKNRTCSGNHRCNCDKNDRRWRSDTITISDKSVLPITQLRIGDTDSKWNENGYYTLSPLICSG